jgi:Leucine-rich repeat (LRR) protein
VLNLSGNKLTFGERNFEANTLLTKIDLSNNDVQFLSPNVFDGLHRLESINLENNHLTKIDACTFSETQLSPISAKYSPLKINLQGNPIECDCNVFYLNRHLNQQLNLTCSKPDYYKDKKFDDLKREDPAKR